MENPKRTFLPSQYCQIQTKTEEVGKTTRPFRYDLNQIPYNYTLEGTKRFPGIRSDRQNA